MIAGRGEDRDDVKRKGRAIGDCDRIKAFGQYGSAGAAEYQREWFARHLPPAGELAPVDPVQDHFGAGPAGTHPSAEITDEILGAQFVDRFRRRLHFALSRDHPATLSDEKILAFVAASVNERLPLSFALDAAA